MSLVFQNIDLPPTPLSARQVCPPPPPPPPNEGRGTHSPGGEGGGGSIFWKTRDIGLASYSNNLSTSTRMVLPGSKGPEEAGCGRLAASGEAAAAETSSVQSHVLHNLHIKIFTFR
jgi:hypothetical protein